MARNVPSRASSPSQAASPGRPRSSHALTMAAAIARSKPLPSFGSCAGARLIVTLRPGNSKPLLLIAIFTRSRASWSARSPSPTMWNPGRPSAMFASTSTRTPSRPKTVPERALASTRGDITLVCVYASACSRMLLTGSRRFRARTGGGLTTLQLAQRHEALNQEEQDQQPKPDPLDAGDRDGGDGVDRVQSQGDAQRQQRAAHGEVAEDQQDQAFSRDPPTAPEQLQQDADAAQFCHQAKQQGQPADDIERDVGVAVPAPEFRLVECLRHRDPPVPR